MYAKCRICIARLCLELHWVLVTCYSFGFGINCNGEIQFVIPFGVCYKLGKISSWNIFWIFRMVNHPLDSIKPPPRFKVSPVRRRRFAKFYELIAKWPLSRRCDRIIENGQKMSTIMIIVGGDIVIILSLWLSPSAFTREESLSSAHNAAAGWVAKLL